MRGRSRGPDALQEPSYPYNALDGRLEKLGVCMVRGGIYPWIWEKGRSGMRIRKEAPLTIAPDCRQQVTQLFNLPLTTHKNRWPAPHPQCYLE
jgi:hypothetical protein